MTSIQPKKRYALIGTGHRSAFYYLSIATTFSSTSQLVAFIDTNQTRLNYANSRLQAISHPPIPTYHPDNFSQMVTETKPNELIITTVDSTHAHYIQLAHSHSLNVITEKPMTIDIPSLQTIFSSIERTQRNLRVTFNYRYAPHNTTVFRLLQQDEAIGTITAVHFEWMLNVSHGADYFRRWHRDRQQSGGLLVHKSTHHFDLVNWWLQSRPETVFAMGGLRFYGRENASKRGVRSDNPRTYGSENADRDPFALLLDQDLTLKALYLDAEHEDGYHRDQNVFGEGISIEDTLSVLVKYRNGAQMSYSLTAYSPMEGFRISFTGTKGRLDLEVIERSYLESGGKEGLGEEAFESTSLILRPQFGKPQILQVPYAEGGHGGGDPALLNDMFGTPEEDVFKRRASHIDGAFSILTGIAASKSIETGQAVEVDSLIQIPEQNN